MQGLKFYFCDLDREKHRLLFSWLWFYFMFTSKFNILQKMQQLKIID